MTFFIGRVIPVDPVLAIVGDRAPAERGRARRASSTASTCRCGEQFLFYVKKALTGDFGNSVLSTYPVMQDIRRVFPATLELATLGTLIGLFLGIPLGVLAAVKRGSLSTRRCASSA